MPMLPNKTTKAYNAGNVRIISSVFDETQFDVTARSGSNWSSLNQRITALLLFGMDCIANEQEVRSGEGAIKGYLKQ